MSGPPSGWVTAELAVIVEVLDSARVPVSSAERERRIQGKASGGLYPYYGATGLAGKIDGFLFDEDLCLLGEDGVSFLDPKRIKAYTVSGKSWVNNHAHVLRAKPEILDLRYLVGFLNAFDYRGRVTGTTRLKLTQGAMKTIPVALPPLAEQRRIADKLDELLAKVDACRERLDRIPSILKRFRQAVLAAATSGELTRDWRGCRGQEDEFRLFDFADADVFCEYRFPASWDARRLSEVADIAGGLTKDSKKQDLGYRELPYLRVANVQRGFLDLTEVKTIRVPDKALDALLLRPGDILFNEGGDIDKLGRGWVWGGELPECTFQNHVFRVRLNEPSWEPKFFSYFGNSRAIDYFSAKGKQTTNLASINKSVLSSLPVPVPPWEEQAEIVRRVEAMFAKAALVEALHRSVAAKVAALTPSILAKAFRGELVPQDPNDEPASELLARIRASAESAPKKRTRRSSPAENPKARRARRPEA